MTDTGNPRAERLRYVPVKKHEIFDGVTFQWFMCGGILMVPPSGTDLEFFSGVNLFSRGERLLGWSFSLLNIPVTPQALMGSSQHHSQIKMSTVG